MNLHGHDSKRALRFVICLARSKRFSVPFAMSCRMLAFAAALKPDAEESFERGVAF